jgi:c-di-GMP-binding flagellar brake protein YcgR
MPYRPRSWTNRPGQGPNRYENSTIADLQPDSDLAEPINPTSDIHPSFAQHHPLQIAVCLRKLVCGQDFVTVESGGRQIVTQILDVDSRNARFIFDAGSVEANNQAVNQAVPRAQQLVFRSLPGGIRTEFTTQPARQIVFEGRPASEAPFPPVLYSVQRREYFRVQTPVLAPYIASGPYTDGGSFRVELQDLSLGGVALRTADARFGSLDTGCVLRDVTLQLGAFGTLRLDLEIVSPRQSATPKGDRRFVMGGRFVTVPGPAERMLQRAVAQLETRRQTLLPRA